MYVVEGTMGGSSTKEAVSTLTIPVVKGLLTPHPTQRAV